MREFGQTSVLSTLGGCQGVGLMTPPHPPCPPRPPHPPRPPAPRNGPQTRPLASLWQEHCPAGPWQGSICCPERPLSPNPVSGRRDELAVPAGRRPRRAGTVRHVGGGAGRARPAEGRVVRGPDGAGQLPPPTGAAGSAPPAPPPAPGVAVQVAHTARRRHSLDSHGRPAPLPTCLRVSLSSLLIWLRAVTTPDRPRAPF